MKYYLIFVKATSIILYVPVSSVGGLVGGRLIN